jgi:fibronectin-binding autotransporter adhesin
MKAGIPSLVLLASWLTATQLRSANLTWDTTIAADGVITAGSGTWTNGAGNWNNGTTSSGINWNNTTPDAALFAGTDGAYDITLGGAITTNSLTFNNSGYSLIATSAQTITLGTGGIAIASGKSATIGTNVTVTRTGAYNISGGGTLNINGTGARVSTSNNQLINVSGGTKIVIGTGGTLNNGTSIALGNADTSANNEITVNGGTLEIVSAAPAASNIVLANGSSGSATITLTTGNITNNRTDGALRFGQSGVANSASSVFHLNGGILTVPRVFEGHTSHTSTFNFNGGTLRALTNSTSLSTFMTGVDTANVRNGGAILDSNAQHLTVGQTLLHSTIGGDNAIDGGLTKQGSGTIIIGGNNSYTGVTTITTGGLIASVNNALGTTDSNTTIAANALFGLTGGINYTTAEAIVGSGVGNLATGGPLGSVQRGFVQSVSGNNSFAGSIQINATGTSRFGTQNGAQLTLSGTISLATGTTGVSVLFRAGNTDGDFVTLSGTGNTWDASTVIYSDNTGTGSGVRLGVDDGLSKDAPLSAATSAGTGTTLDLAGFDQTVSGLTVQGAGTTRLRITNTAAATLSVLTSGGSSARDFGTGGIIADGAGTVQFVKTGSYAQTLSAASTYTGGTLIQGGSLLLSGAGSLADTGSISLTASGATFGISGITASFEKIGSLNGVSGSNINLGAKNLEFGTAANDTFSGSFTASAGASLTKVGNGNFTLGTTATFTGAPGINIAAGTLLTSANNLIPDTSAFTLSGGKFSTDGFSDTVGTLKVTGNSLLDLGAGTSIITFADSQAESWSALLSILNWNGNLIGGGLEQVIFGTDASALTSTQLAAISFVDPAGLPSGTYGAQILSNGELVPVPEPTALAMGTILLALVGFRESRTATRRRQQRR